MNSIYEVSSSFTLIMSKPNLFSQVLGMLTRGTQIEVNSFSGNWACFSYNATTAYVRKNSLKFINNTPTVKTGSVIIKYLDSETNDDVHTSKTINNLSMGTYSYEAQNVSGYKLTTNSPQSITLTESSPNATITFYYTKILCSITIHYVDENTENDISNSQVINNLSLGTYTYSYIEVSGYKLDDTETKTITFTENNTDITIIFKYKEILGSVVINYIDNSSTALLETETISNLKLGNYTYSSKSISGYSILNPSTQTITITAETPNVEITFKYNKLYGSITLQYVDNDSNTKLSDDEKYTNLEFGSYTYSAKSFSNYKLIGSQTQTITINDTNLNATIVFSYSKVLGSITIKYLEKDTLVELSPETVLKNIELGSYSFDALSIDGYSITGSSSQTVDLSKDNLNVTIVFEYEKIEIQIPSDLNWNEVPYISTYYIKPIVKPGEEVFIDYYITDYYYKEYMENYNLKEDNWGDDTWTEEVWNNEIFTVTVRIEGQKDKVYPNLKAGDHQVSLGSFSTEGEQKFSILCTDKYGRNSHELFNFFLVQGDVEVKEYVMTDEDLVTYNIKNTDDYEEKIYIKVDSLTDTTTGTKIEEVANATVVPSHKYICFIGTTEEDENGNPIMQTTSARFWLNTIVKYADDYDKDAVLTESTNTRIGLQKLLDDKKSEGYNKLLLLPGTYRIDHQGTIYIPDKFTLDMNGATLKGNQFTGYSSLMLSLDGTFNSHVINGNIEGDYFSHDYANSTNNSEWVNGVSIDGEAKYSSFENIIIRNITGYGGGNGISQKSGYTYFAKELGNIFKLGDISTIDGSNILSTERQSTDFIDISSYIKYEYIAINKYLGYQGMLGGSWNLILHFYDNDKNYIKSISAFQYRRTRIPSNSYFMKVTILSPTASNDFRMVYFKVPCHCNFTNVKFYNCRCVGLAQAAMNNMLVYNCKWSLNGQSGAFCAYDAEDGWDMMQDVTIKSCNFINNYRNDFLTCAGHNFIIDGQASGKIYMWERTRSSVIINCNNTNITIQGGSSDTIVKHGVYRVYNNNFAGGNVANNLSKNNTSTNLLAGTVYSSTINGFSSASIYNNCTIIISSIFTAYLSKISIINSTLKPSTNFNDRYMLSFNNSYLDNCCFENCNFKGKCSLANHNGFCSGKFVNCIFEDVNISPNVLANSDDLILFDSCTINYSSNNLIYYSPFAYTKGTFSQIEFIKCTIINNDNNLKPLIYAYAKPNGYCKFTDCNITIPNSIIIFDITNSNISLIEDYLIEFTNSKLPTNINLINDTFKSNKNITITIQ